MKTGVFRPVCYVVTLQHDSTKILLYKNGNVWAPQKRIFTSKTRLNSEVYGQESKITPEAEKKKAPESFLKLSYVCYYKIDLRNYLFIRKLVKAIIHA